MMGLYMEQNNNRFLLHRKFVREGKGSLESLYKISRSQLATVLQIIALSDEISDMRRGISWFVSATSLLQTDFSALSNTKILYYGLPGASILAVDLLKQSTQPYHCRNRHLDVVPRSEVIQNLSVLVSHLQRAVRYEGGNRDSCKWAHRVLSLILEQVIDPKLPYCENEATQDPMTPNNINIAGNMDNDLLNIDDFLTWVEETEWNCDSSAFMI